MKDAPFVFLIITLVLFIFMCGYVSSFTNWQEGTPKPYEKIIADFETKQVEAMYTGKFWCEWRKDDGLIKVFNGAPVRWHYVLF